MVLVAKIIAHFVICLFMVEVLKGTYSLTGAKFWIPYLLIGMALWFVNARLSI